MSSYKLGEEINIINKFRNIIVEFLAPINRLPNGKNKEYKGIVLAIDNKSIEIYWDTIDGKYRPQERDIAFSNCQIEEIFSGTEKYSSIEKDKNYN